MIGESGINHEVAKTRPTGTQGFSQDPSYPPPAMATIAHG